MPLLLEPGQAKRQNQLYFFRSGGAPGTGGIFTTPALPCPDGRTHLEADPQPGS